MFAKGVLSAVLAGGFAYCVHILFSPSPLILALVVLTVLAGMTYVAKK